MVPSESYPHIMLREIHEQPAAVADTLRLEGDKIRALTDDLRDRPMRFILLAARGTSDNAGTYARYLFGVINGMVVASAAPSLLTMYNAHMDIANALVLGISQSGKATDVVEMLRAARQLGATTIGLTNTADSPMCDVAEYPLLTHAREEKAVAATKTFTTALAVIHELSARWAGRDDLCDSLRTVPEIMEKTFEVEPYLAARTERYRYMESCTILARGVDYATAHEFALKLEECCYVNPQYFSAADYMHGPIAALEPGTPVFLLAPAGASLPSMLEVGQEVRKRGAEVIVFSDNEEALALAHVPVKLPDLGGAYWSPLITAEMAQLFTYHLAIHKGLDPDQPRGLKKVTLTY